MREWDFLKSPPDDPILDDDSVEKTHVSSSKFLHGHILPQSYLDLNLDSAKILFFDLLHKFNAFDLDTICLHDM